MDVRVGDHAVESSRGPGRFVTGTDRRRVWLTNILWMTGRQLQEAIELLLRFWIGPYGMCRSFPTVSTPFVSMYM